MAVAIKGRRHSSYEGVLCPHCGARLPQSRLETGEVVCTFCNGQYEGVAFTPPVRKARVKHIAESGPGGSAACARHERNAAAANCERCGNFMCNLCRIDTDGMALCPSCFERLSDEGALPSSLKSFKNYSGMAGSMAAAGILLLLLAPIFGPAAIFYGVKAFKQKREMGERDGKIMLYLIMILAVLETIFGIVLIAALFGVFR